ncbi:YlmH/Sll1252 family protein [Bombilactobacillus folatiphilus]|uniref:YlmH/Sll1252 family protein n=1 Tax=Bombilactobacillus folatiphilus TaxID=2923362 RepID=A0ABY4PAP3_9LACO|nr:YlmH/Sll1252 family protein [Bombilactobacillus folatiphilus]UQS82709.1 YlmH/Sll1252 family protein [Bombilactobacillus folatiphilus]
MKNNSDQLFKLKNLIRAAHTNYSKQVSNFLNPYEQRLAQELLTNMDEFVAKFSGGYPQAQRKRLLIVPPYLEYSSDDLEIQLFQINFNERFVKLHHHQIMGKLLHLGLDEGTFGDIITDGSHWQFFAQKHCTALLEQEVTRIGNFKVSIQPIDRHELLLVKSEYQMVSVNTSSLRIDQLISVVFQLSRQTAKELIHRGEVMVNWQREKRSDYIITVGDSISVHGFGRATLVDLLGHKNQKWQLYLQVYRH